MFHSLEIQGEKKTEIENYKTEQQKPDQGE